MKTLLIQTYFFKHLLVSTAINTLVLTSILLYGNLQKHDNSLLQALGSSPSAFFELILLLVPYSLSMGLPFGFSLAVLFCIGRWASSREILALRSLGIGVFQWSACVFFLALLLALLSTYSSLEWGPVNRAKFESRKKEILWDNLNAVLSENGHFDLDVNRNQNSDSVKSLEGLCEGNVSKISISVSDVESGNWRNVRILMSDATGQILSVIHSAEAEVSRSEDKENLMMNLHEVDIEPGFPKQNSKEAPSSSRFVSFKSWKQPLIINLFKKPQQNLNDFKRLGFAKILRLMETEKNEEKRKKAMFVLNKNFALGCSPFFLALLLVPIAAQKGRKESMLNLILGILACLFYFGMGSLCSNLLKSTHLSHLSWWIPNLFCFALGIALLICFEKRVN